MRQRNTQFGRGQRRETSSRKVSVERALSKLGFCSRSTARRLIREKRVSIDGCVCTSASLRVDMQRDRISVDGRLVTAARSVYLMLNKPRGLVTTWADEQARPTVYGCLDDATLPWVSPVGRLDKASEGLLLFTNDTQWAAGVLDPGAHVERVYHVQVSFLVDEAVLVRLVKGVGVPGGQLHAKSARVLRRGQRNCWLEISLDEGKNRQIRRMLTTLDIRVLRLVRVAIGPLKLGELRKGEFRHLTEAERDALVRR